MTDPTKLIAIMKVMLSELEQMLSTAPEPTNEQSDTRTARLRNQIDRLEVVLRKHQDAEGRKRELAKQNKHNTKAPVKNRPSGQQRNSSRQSLPY